ncbi:competence type IV pilus ATPase ComGA [Caryophanon tenue]|uniref:Bacterial type II secretion system protein E domain-containing protein n=1 Tax=Caryophanon tenue TaxID=33978 RepID=A0A1C0YN57_9BACL|nr:competence type IV pilus ATPase ComGA [Caryophanon tenue]OCS88596.1 hypothetical protein A6M13_01760 [Caryophanon tenue]
MEQQMQQHVYQLLREACMQQVSDIHFIPTETAYDIAFRQQGILQRRHIYEHTRTERIVTYLKYLANLDIAERRKPQSGAFFLTIDQQPYHFRLSTLPSVRNKESIVIRIHLQYATLPLSELAYFPTTTEHFEQLLSKSQGIIFITGATNSGKTTTLYAFIHHIATELHKHVISLEDPVESIQSHVLQIQVNERAGVSYASGLRAILRHTPDVIMVGEIRDEATAKLAITAALTGHLVLATIHAKDTVGCIHRLIDLGVPLEDLHQTLLAVIAQSLVMLQEEGSICQRAIFELLIQEELQAALHCISEKNTYELPMQKRLEYQREAVKLLEMAATQTTTLKKA